ncbi:MAG: ATP-dependent RecD-like DNA helicase [Desulfobacterales bacterium]|nr:ATP-dependent RecD-like DNA helicase [Desulfobacterales bacterium]
MITINGYLEHITYYNKENHYTIAKIKTKDSATPLTVVGYMAGAAPGQSLKIKGTWETHRRYGLQIKVDSFEVILPDTVDGIVKYLESGIIKGIGKKTASRIVNLFGAKTLEIIEKYPEELTRVEGIGGAKAALINKSWKNHHTVRALMSFLQENGIKTSSSAKILKVYGEDAIDIIKNDPFRLAADIPGEGFFIADAITRNMGIENDDSRRVKACISYIISQHIEDGHVFACRDQIIYKCSENFNIDHDVSETFLDELADEGEIVMETNLANPDLTAVYPKLMHIFEKGITNRLFALLSTPLPIPSINTERISQEILKKLAIKLSPAQLEVLEQALFHRVVIITGGPGTGKTTLIQSITAIFEGLGKIVSLAAPTGRAARRLSEVTGRDAKTIHRLLGYNFIDDCFEKNIDDPLEADAVIIDETSMVDISLMFHLLKAIPSTSVLILIGDIFQLPSVGPGNVLSDMIRSELIPAYYLKEIFRQAEESPIILNAHKVRNGELPDLDSASWNNGHSEFYFIEQDKPEGIVKTIVNLSKKDVPEKFGLDPANDIQILTPMHKGDAGTINLNRELQKALNRNPVVAESMSNIFRVGDKVMHLKNNYHKEVFNGDIGTISTINPESKRISVIYYGRTVNYDSEETGEITLAYAISVHKSQGSEYPAVIVPLTTHHYILLQRNLLYTAMTRGKKLVILVGSKKAFKIALNNDRRTLRLSNLAERLMNMA